uniref:(northern house mosquito) hypothetical protein n=1 Tax=Culex pipiens TaxID=7175 RepID=A0A8D8HD96_CULPI
MFRHLVRMCRRHKQSAGHQPALRRTLLLRAPQQRPASPQQTLVRVAKPSDVHVQVAALVQNAPIRQVERIFPSELVPHNRVPLQRLRRPPDQVLQLLPVSCTLRRHKLKARVPHLNPDLRPARPPFRCHNLPTGRNKATIPRNHPPQRVPKHHHRTSVNIIKNRKRLPPTLNRNLANPRDAGRMRVLDAVLPRVNPPLGTHMQQLLAGVAPAPPEARPIREELDQRVPMAVVNHAQRFRGNLRRGRVVQVP